jgi:hypothetical protein
MSKGVASILVPIGGAIRLATGTWTPMFVLAILLNAIASIACATILPRLAKAHCEKAALGEVTRAVGVIPAVAGGSE